MRAFTRLYVALDSRTGTHAKVDALASYFAQAPAADAAWATFFLIGRKLKRLVKAADLRRAALDAAGVPEWLFNASYDAVGDIAETIALLLPHPVETDDAPLATWVERELLPLYDARPEDIAPRLHACWQRLDRDGRFVFLKLVTGEFRVGAARQLVFRALARIADVPVTDVAQRLTGEWAPGADFWDALKRPATRGEHRPYPFFLAYPLDDDPSTLGAIELWQAEWKWDGIRAQLVVRDDRASLWSRGEELIDEQFPEIVAAARALPAGTVIDGEILPWRADEPQPLPFALLQQRLGRKAPSAKIQRDVPVVLLAYDLLEIGGHDIRARSLDARRAELVALRRAHGTIRVIDPLPASRWADLAALRVASREHAAEGLMLKRRDSAYGVGRTRGAWWKWKIEPHTIDAVLVYAQPGHGRRASLYTDYTFGLWEEGELVPFAKAYSGLTDDEIREADAWIRSHTIEKFGPVRRVAPELVFELAFENIQLSKRHKSGVAVRFPRIARWRRDKPPSQADTLRNLKALIDTRRGPRETPV